MSERANHSVDGPTYLFGAGASKDAGLPSSPEMTEEIFRTLQRDGAYDEVVKILAMVIGALQFQRGLEVSRQTHNALSLGDEPFGLLDVERVFRAVTLLADRDALEVAPFVGAWRRRVHELDTATSSFHSTGDLEQVVEDIARQAGDSLKVNKSGELERALDDVFERKLAGAGDGEAYEQTAAAMLGALRKILWVEDPESGAYLQDLLELAENEQVLITSLNYDNLVECVAEDLGVDIHLAVEDLRTEGEFAPPAQGVTLLKLHGSINWVQTSELGNSGENLLPEPSIRIADDSPHSRVRPNSKLGVIFGGGNKLRPDGPYLPLLRTFETQLLNRNSLVVVGYSFRDEHINTIIRRWMNAGSDRQMEIVDPSIKTRIKENEFLSSLRSYCGDCVEFRETTAKGYFSDLED